MTVAGRNPIPTGRRRLLGLAGGSAAALGLGGALTWPSAVAAFALPQGSDAQARPRRRTGAGAAAVNGAQALGPTLSAAEARQAWARIQAGLDARSYEGVLLVLADDTVTSLRIDAGQDGPRRVERLETLDGRPRIQWRFPEQVVTLWPRDRVAVFESPYPVPEFPSVPRGSADRVMDRYDFIGVGSDRVAGLDADVQLLRARDPLRFSRRLWVERETGLLLRCEVLDPAGRPLEVAAFSTLQWQARPRAEALALPASRFEGVRQARLVSVFTDPEPEGWRIGPLPRGWVVTSVAKRPMPAAVDGSTGPTVLQVVFTDGLACVSVFAEDWDPQRPRQPMRGDVGATQTRSGRVGAHWLTAVGEAPAPVLSALMAALRRGPVANAPGLAAASASPPGRATPR